MTEFELLVDLHLGTECLGPGRVRGGALGGLSAIRATGHPGMDPECEKA